MERKKTLAQTDQIQIYQAEKKGQARVELVGDPTTDRWARKITVTFDRSPTKVTIMTADAQKEAALAGAAPVASIEIVKPQVGTTTLGFSAKSKGERDQPHNFDLDLASQLLGIRLIADPGSDAGNLVELINRSL